MQNFVNLNMRTANLEAVARVFWSSEQWLGNCTQKIHDSKGV